MQNSSARRVIEAEAGGFGEQSKGGVSYRSPSAHLGQTSEGVRTLPSMDPSLYAATSKAAGRINASVISEDEHNDLLHERQKLLDKKFDGLATRKELNRLEYVRWSLDRIEDAKHGASLEHLESLVATYEKLHADILRLSNDLDSYRPTKK